MAKEQPEKKRARDHIQEEVDRIRAFSSAEDWADFLGKKGRGHHVYYHYTTLGTLKAMLESSSWKFKRADLSNDPLESPVHSTSFTSSSLSSMGMWEMYSRLSKGCSLADLGVRIGIEKATFNKIFAGNAVWYKMDVQGVFHEFRKATPDVSDMAYWHFGKTQESSLAIYRNYQLAGGALHFHFKDGEKLPPCFKTGIWRKEEEVRVYHDFSSLTDVPEDLYLKIKPEHFGKMSFRLSPAVGDPCVLQKLFQSEVSLETLLFFVSRILAGKLSVSQFHLPNEYEQWRSRLPDAQGNVKSSQTLVKKNKAKNK